MSYIKNTYSLTYLLLLLLLYACGPSVPASYTETSRLAAVSPDNAGAAVPPNIAPLTFRIEEEGSDFVTHWHSKGGELIVSGKEVCPDVNAWHKLLDSSRGDSLFADIYVKTDAGWIRYAPIGLYVAEEPIDPYITYRLIRPSYVTYEELTINERSLESFDERVVYENMRFEDSDKGQCINCHMPHDWNRNGQSQFHVRQALGGTILIDGDKATKVNLKTDSTLSAGVYPAWHPTLNLIAYSVNETGQVFHTLDPQKVEVIDYASDLILYDIDANTVQSIDRTSSDFESFPTWSPDGRTLYYISAHYTPRGTDIDADLDSNYDQLHYNIYARDFDLSTRRFGPRRIIFDAESEGKSASIPRVSPDGQYLLFTLADYGQFHIWHKSAELVALPTHTREVSEVATPLALGHASYHSWSSNGRWILFSSRRDDGNYTRLYISYFDSEGRAHKPFRMPQASTDADDLLLRSYNAAEFLVQPVQISHKQLSAVVRGDATPARYAGSALLNPEHDSISANRLYVRERRGQSVGY